MLDDKKKSRGSSGLRLYACGFCLGGGSLSLGRKFLAQRFQNASSDVSAKIGTFMQITNDKAKGYTGYPSFTCRKNISPFGIEKSTVKSNSTP
ncbi:unnamed protein product [Trichobilharzia regenti]|nr:unnamed protein product [Trichobilharzia regenti]